MYKANPVKLNLREKEIIIYNHNKRREKTSFQQTKFQRIYILSTNQPTKKKLTNQPTYYLPHVFEQKGSSLFKAFQFLSNIAITGASAAVAAAATA